MSCLISVVGFSKNKETSQISNIQLRDEMNNFGYIVCGV